MKIYFLILGMALVTYFGRVLPVLFLGEKTNRPRVEKFLSLIPYSAMTALVFPGVLSVDKDFMAIGVVGALTALALSWFNMSITFVVIGSIVVNMLMYAM
jgi:branched-subunit amino acid transport protein